MKFLLAQRAYVDDFPPTLHQAAILSDHGDVVLLDAAFPNDPDRSLADPRVRRERLRLESDGGPFARLRRLTLLVRFYARLRSLVAKKPSAVIAYEPDAASMMLTADAAGFFRIVHLHELPDEENYVRSPTARRFRAHMLRHLSKADLVIVPDQHRADFTQKLAGLQEAPTVVMNCPRLVSTLPESRLIPFLRERGITTNRIVQYHGSVGPDHNLERVVQSMPLWPEDSVFVVVGRPREPFTTMLLEMAAELGVAHRVVIVGRVPYDQVMSYAVGATVGMSMLDASKGNWMYSAGASNKRFEYVAMGVPQVTNDGPGIDDLFVKTGVASVARYDDVKDIGEKINAYLTNPELCEQTAQRARALHQSTYNYERQFQPVLERVLAAVARH